jgi:hypothetical protein
MQASGVEANCSLSALATHATTFRNGISHCRALSVHATISVTKQRGTGATVLSESAAVDVCNCHHKVRYA